MSSKSFYKAFEDKHRGSRENIKDRLHVYLKYILNLKNIYPDVPVLDIGCGRGEWLELLKDNGISARGIDTDPGMLEPGREIGLDVLQGDGIEFLTKQKDSSKIVISAFHVVEHISFDDLLLLVKEALRVLKPGGILILETPNPENIKVSTENFYTDPTHIKPIPSSLLSFIPEYYGYERFKVLRLQESSSLIHKNDINLMEVLVGVSPDYAVVAQKAATDDILKQFDEVFGQDTGLSLPTLVGRFEGRLLNLDARIVENRADITEKKIQLESVIERALETEQQLELVIERTLKTEQQLESVIEQTIGLEHQFQSSKVRVTEAENKVQEVQNEVSNILSSTSWRITYPLRLIKLNYKFIRAHGFSKRIKVLFAKLISTFILFLNKHPKVRANITLFLRKVGALSLCKKIYFNLQSKSSASNKPESLGGTDDDLGKYSRKLYNDLKYLKKEK